MLLGISLVKGIENLLTPLVEDSLELSEHLWWEFSSVTILSLIFPLSVIRFESDVVNQGLQGLSKLAGELVENLRELSFLIVWALIPILNLKIVNEWLVDLVDHRVEGGDSMLRDLSEQDVVVISSSFRNVFLTICLGGTNKVKTFALKLDFLTVRHNEFFVLTNGVDNFSRLRDLVWSLVVNENSCGSDTFLEVIEDLSKLGVSKNFESIELTDFECISYDRGHPFGPRCHCHCDVTVSELSIKVFL